MASTRPAERSRRIATLLAAAGVGGTAVLGLGILAIGWPVVALLGLLVLGVLAVERPDLLVPLLFVSIFVEGVGLIGSLGGVPLTLAKLATLGIFAVWTAHALLRRKSLVEPTPLTWPMLACLATMVYSLSQTDSGDLREGLLPIVSFATLIVLVHLLDRTLTPRSLPLQLDLMAWLGAAIVVAAFLSGRRVEEYGVERFAGFFTGPNMWATALLVVGPLVFGWLARDRRPWSIVLIVVLASMIPISIIHSMSRAGFLVMLLISPAILVLLWPRRRILLVPLVAITLLVPLVVETEVLTSRYEAMWDVDAGETDESLNEREGLLRTGVGLLQEHWLLGAGAGAFRYEAMVATNGAMTRTAHNTYLTLSVEQGVLGVLSHAWLMFALLQSAWVAVVRAPTRRLRSLGLGYAISVLAFGMMAFTLNLITFAMAFFVFGLGLAIRRTATLPAEQVRELGLADA